MKTSILKAAAKAALLCGAFLVLASCSKDEKREPAPVTVKINVTVSGSVDRSTVDAFRPDTPLLEDYWSVPYNLERTFSFYPPQGIPDEYLSLIVDDPDIMRNTDIVSDKKAKWTIVDQFVGYKNGLPTDVRLKSVHNAEYKSYMLIYVDRNVILNGSLGIFNDVKHEWGAILRKGWNAVKSQEYNEGRSIGYANVPEGDATIWYWN